MCSAEWVDSKNRSPGRFARFFDSNCLGVDQFLPLLDIAALPVVGLVALALTLATLTARWQFPRQIPERSGR